MVYAIFPVAAVDVLVAHLEAASVVALFVELDFAFHHRSNRLRIRHRRRRTSVPALLLHRDVAVVVVSSAVERPELLAAEQSCSSSVEVFASGLVNDS